jgi:peroxiredoxin
VEQIFVISSILLWLVVVFNLILTLATIRRLNGPGEKKVGPEKGSPAPDFTAETLQGEHVTLARYAGKRTAFLFVAPNCIPCREGMPQFEEWYSQAEQSGVSFVLVSNGSLADTQALVQELHISLPVLVAPRASNSFVTDYKISSTPSYCLIDAQGIVESAGYPSINFSEWKNLLDSWERNKYELASSVSS